MMNGQIVPALTGNEGFIAVAALLLVASATKRFWVTLKRISR
jgi:hypothetical protein